MRNILSMILLGLAVSTISTLSMASTDNIGNTECRKGHLRIIPDSIYQLTDKKAIITYNVGHHGYNWSIIVKNDTTFETYSGSTHYGSQKITVNIKENQFDTIHFFNTYKDLIQWGFDSLPIRIKDMEPIQSTDYPPFHAALRVFDEQRCEEVIISNRVKSYSGVDSVNFNVKLENLRFLMDWLAVPEIRTYLKSVIDF